MRQVFDKILGNCQMIIERDSLVPWQKDASKFLFVSVIPLVFAKQNLVLTTLDLLVNGVHASLLKVKKLAIGRRGINL